MIELYYIDSVGMSFVVRITSPIFFGRVILVLVLCLREMMEISRDTPLEWVVMFRSFYFTFD